MEEGTCTGKRLKVAIIGGGLVSGPKKFCSNIDCLKTLLYGVERMKCSGRGEGNAPVMSSSILVVRN